MKKIMLSMIALLALGSAHSVFAEDTATSSASFRADIRKDLRDAHLEIKSEREVNREDMKERHAEVVDLRKDIKTATSTTERTSLLKMITEKRKAAGLERGQHMIKRYNDQISRLENAITKTQAHITELKAKGFDAAMMEAKLTVSQTSVATAKANVATLNIAIQSALTNADTINDALKALKSQVRDTEQSIRTAEKDVRAAMRVRIPRPVKPVTATTTATTTASTTTN